MKKSISFLLVLLVTLGFGLATPASASEGRSVTVKAGDTLSRIAGRNWRAVCKANNIPNCARLRVGQQIRLSTASVAPQGTSQVVAGGRDAEGYFQWKVVGLRNLRIYQGQQYLRHTQVLVMREMGVSEAEITEVVEALKNGTAEEGQMTRGMKFAAMSYSTRKGIRIQQKVMYVGEETHRIWRVRTSGGRVITIVEKCDNVGLEEAPPPPPLPPPPPPPELPPVILPPPPAPEPEAKGNCWDPKLVIGQEYEPSHDGGNHSRSTFASGALYKCWRGEHGTHGIGVGFQASMWDGSVNSNLGKYEGNFVGVGPAYEYISDSGYDIEGKLLVGRLTEEFEQGDYSSERKFGMLGVAGVYNNYSRRMRGEKWLPETQVFAFAGVPISRDVKHSWQGKPIEDTHDLSKLGVLAQAGVRQWLYEDDKIPVLPYVQFGTFVETPGNWTGSARLGIADRNRICGVGVGVDVDFIHGGSVFGLGWWCDVVRGIRYIRKDKRSEQITDNPNGYRIVPIGQNLAAEQPSEGGSRSAVRVSGFHMVPTN